MRLTMEEFKKMNGVWGKLHSAFNVLEGLRPAGGFSEYIEDTDTALLDACSEKSRKIKDLKAQLDHKQRINEKLCDKIDNLERDAIKHLIPDDNRLAAADIREGTLRRRVEELEKENKKLNINTTGLTVEVTDKDQKIDELNKENNDLSYKLSNLRLDKIVNVTDDKRATVSISKVDMVREDDVENLADVIWWIKGYMASCEKDDSRSDLGLDHIDSLRKARINLNKIIIDGK